MTQINGVLVTGIQGSQGVQGITGVQGLQGVQNIQGTVGLVGAQGNNGPKGIQGVSNILSLNSGKRVSCAFLQHSSTVVALLAGRITAVPFISAYDISYSSLSIYVSSGVASALCKILIYDDLNGAPNNLIVGSPDLDCSTTGQKTFSVTGTFSGGVTYWLCVWSSTNPSVQGVPVTAISSMRLSTVTPLSSYTRTITYSATPPNPFGSTTPQTSSSTLVMVNLT